MTDAQFRERATTILRNMCLERRGFWATLFKRRWVVPAEPLRNDAGHLLKAASANINPPSGACNVADDWQPGDDHYAPDSDNGAEKEDG